MVQLQIVGDIRTGWTPYSVAFSHRGDRLAIGGGTWYGMGGIVLASVPSRDRRDHPVGGDHGSETVSGLAWSTDDRHLVASGWSASQRYAPTRVFAASKLELREEATCTHRPATERSDPTPTGIVLTSKQIFVRNNASESADLLSVWNLPENVTVSSADQRRHMTSSRLAVVGNALYTGGGGSLKMVEWRPETGTTESGRVGTGLAQFHIGSDPSRVNFLPVERPERVTAVCSTEDGQSLLIGNLDGRIHRWDPVPGGPGGPGGPAENETLACRELCGSRTKAKPAGDLPWATYRPESVVGICGLNEPGIWAAIDAGGELLIWRGDELVHGETVAAEGSPRSIAAHPNEPLLAIAVKAGFKGSFKSGAESDPNGSGVYLVRVETE